MSSAKVLFVVTSHDHLGETDSETGYHLAEVTHVYNRLKDADMLVDFASPIAEKAPMDPTSLDLEDADNHRFMNDSVAVNQIHHCSALSDINPTDYQAIYFPGGHGTMWDFPNNPDIAKLINAIYDAGGVIAAICHGPAALVGVKTTQDDYFVANKTITCFSDEEERLVKKDGIVPFLLESELQAQGAKIHIKAPWECAISHDSRIITGQNPQSANALAEALIKALG